MHVAEPGSAAPCPPLRPGPHGRSLHSPIQTTVVPSGVCQPCTGSGAGRGSEEEACRRWDPSPVLVAGTCFAGAIWEGSQGEWRPSHIQSVLELQVPFPQRVFMPLGFG